MPMYTWECKKCKKEFEHIVKYEDKDNTFLCGCGGVQKRVGVECFKLGKPAYQMKAVLRNGEHVRGHFGKEAKRDSLKRKKS